MPTKRASKTKRRSAVAKKTTKKTTKAVAAKSKKASRKKPASEASKKIGLEQIFAGYLQEEFAQRAQAIRNRFTDELRELYVRQGLVRGAFAAPGWHPARSQNSRTAWPSSY